MAATPDIEHQVTLAKAGDRDAVGALWQGHRRFVATVLLAHAGPRDLDDLLQEVALRVTRSLAGLADARNIRAWLRTIACRVAIDHARRRHGDRRLRPVVVEPMFDALEQQHWRDELELAMRRVEDLEPQYREPLLMRAVGGLGQREIADALGVPISTVETRLARARRQLREVTEAELEPKERSDETVRRTVD